LSDKDGNYAYLTLGGHLYTPKFLKSLDKKVCTDCGDCLEICETRGVDEKGRITIALPNICSGCGHCVNVCKSKGIEAEPIPVEEMRRRVRNYKEKLQKEKSFI